MFYSLVGSESGEWVQFDLTEMPKGIYFVRIRKEQVLVSKKIHKKYVIFQ